MNTQVIYERPFHTNTNGLLTYAFWVTIGVDEVDKHLEI